MPRTRGVRQIRGVEPRLPEAGSVRLHETENQLVVEVSMPQGLTLPRLAARMENGVLTISLPRAAASGASAPSR
jgi:HSP20 family molecular chaperone IbpA